MPEGTKTDKKRITYNPAASAKYIKANYDRIEIKVKKEGHKQKGTNDYTKDEIHAHASSRGESVNVFITRAIAETISRDNSGDVPAPTSTARKSRNVKTDKDTAAIVELLRAKKPCEDADPEYIDVATGDVYSAAPWGYTIKANKPPDKLKLIQVGAKGLCKDIDTNLQYIIKKLSSD